MNFLVRGVRREDLSQIYDLARQFTLLNLPANKKRLAEKIELSEASFRGEAERDQAQYLFVIEDVESEFIAGSAQIVAKHATPDVPNYSFQILKKERFSRDLGIGFIHQILRLRSNTDGCTEIGGLVVDRGYRRRPEKVGRIISLIRFCYIGMHMERFQKSLHSEIVPPLTEEGRSEFWGGPWTAVYRDALC